MCYWWFMQVAYMAGYWRIRADVFYGNGRRHPSAHILDLTAWLANLFLHLETPGAWNFSQLVDLELGNTF
jgi:hypothetical protein